MNYHKIYYKLVSKDSMADYTESHHKIPRCLGGSDDSNNLVKLSAREHYIAHCLLERMYRGDINHAKLVFALNMMSMSSSFHSGERYSNSRLYEANKKRMIEHLCGRFAYTSIFTNKTIYAISNPDTYEYYSGLYQNFIPINAHPFKDADENINNSRREYYRRMATLYVECDKDYSKFIELSKCPLAKEPLLQKFREYAYGILWKQNKPHDIKSQELAELYKIYKESNYIFEEFIAKTSYDRTERALRGSFTKFIPVVWENDRANRDAAGKERMKRKPK